MNLTGLASSYLPQEKKPSLTQTITISPGITLSRFDYERAKERNSFLYFAEYDLIHIERHGRTVPELFHALLQAGELLECEVAFEAVGTLSDPIVNRLPLRLVLASSFGPDAIESLVGRDFGRLSLLTDAPSPIVSETTKEAEEQLQTDVAGRTEFAPGLAQPASRNSGIGHSSTSVPQQAAATEESVRVNVATLETLMNLTGELVLGRNQLRASIAQNDGRALNLADQKINQIGSELQAVVMQTRLQPIGNVFAKLPRLVRDLASSLHKKIQLDIHGKDIALDRTLIEALSDPLTHMVRNAVDHGIESPGDRLKAGKPEKGYLAIGARHEAGQVVVDIADDGRGMDPERIGKAAVAKGLLTAEKLDSMSAKDKTSLIFLPGFSTSIEVSDVSGRGVGMHVVKTKLDRIGGKTEIISVPGQGTTFRVRLPLTLAIIPCLIISVGGEKFAIPQINVEEMRHVMPSDPKTRVETLGDAEALVIRDRLIPLVRFERLLNDTPAHAASSPSSASGARRGTRCTAENGLETVIVTTGTQAYALVVTRFHHTEEIVVKPLGAHLKGLEEYAGATILGDGSVALILDIAGLASKTDIDAAAGFSTEGIPRSEAAEQALSELHSFVLFHNSPEVSCAVHSDSVKRIERVMQTQIETIGGRRTLQYNGGLLPLVALADTAKVDPISDECDLVVIIANIRGREVGLLGAMPVDVVEESGQIDHSTHRQLGVAGSAIIRGSTALIVDLYELVDTAWPEWAAQQATVRPHLPNRSALAVLLAEDSDFFRAQIKRFVTEDGFSVLEAPDGESAWNLLLGNLEKVGAVITDIEMPRLDGLGLVRRIRTDKRTMHLPVIALTSLASDEDVSRGKAAGVNEYQTKLDREQLLNVYTGLRRTELLWRLKLSRST